MSLNFRSNWRDALRGERGRSRLLVAFFLAVSFVFVLLACYRMPAKASAQEPQRPERGESLEEAAARSAVLPHGDR